MMSSAMFRSNVASFMRLSRQPSPRGRVKSSSFLQFDSGYRHPSRWNQQHVRSVHSDTFGTHFAVQSVLNKVRFLVPVSQPTALHTLLEARSGHGTILESKPGDVFSSRRLLRLWWTERQAPGGSVLVRRQRLSASLDGLFVREGRCVSHGYFS